MNINAIEELVQNTIKEARAAYEHEKTASAFPSLPEGAGEARKLASIYEKLAKDPTALSKVAEGEAHSGSDDPRVQPPLAKDLSKTEHPLYTTPNSPHTDQGSDDLVPDTDEDRSTRVPVDIKPVMKTPNLSGEEKVAAGLALAFAAIENREQPDIRKIASITGVDAHLLKDMLEVLASDGAYDGDDDETEEEEREKAKKRETDTGDAEKDAAAENESSTSPTEYAALEEGKATSPESTAFLSGAESATAFKKRQAALASKIGPLQGLFSEKAFADSALHTFFDRAEEAGVKTTRT